MSDEAGTDIIQHGVTCARCGEDIYSNYRHDFTACKCGDTFIDGGWNYRRIGFTAAMPEDVTRVIRTKTNTPFRREKGKRKRG